MSIEDIAWGCVATAQETLTALTTNNAGSLPLDSMIYARACLNARAGVHAGLGNATMLKFIVRPAKAA